MAFSAGRFKVFLVLERLICSSSSLISTFLLLDSLAAFRSINSGCQSWMAYLIFWLYADLLERLLKVSYHQYSVSMDAF